MIARSSMGRQMFGNRAKPQKAAKAVKAEKPKVPPAKRKPSKMEIK